MYKWYKNKEFFSFSSALRGAVDNCKWEKLELDLILVDFNNKILKSFRCQFRKSVGTRSADVSFCSFSLSGVCPNSHSELVSSKWYTKFFRLYFGFSKPFCLSIYRPPFFSQSFPVIMLFEHNCWHFRMRKVFEIQRFSIFQQQENSNLISLTFLAISCELISSFWSLVFFSSGCPHSPCEWTSQKRQNKFVHLSHALSIACGSSDVQVI